MNYAKIIKYDIANAPYVCTTLFVSGCTHNCEGCFNKIAQNFNYGNKWTIETENKFIDYVKDKNVKGVNILGGEPMQQDSKIILHLLKRIKEETNKPVWMWTGCLFEDLLLDKNKKEILKYIYVLIDGQFKLKLRDLKLKYRGSSNQRIINVKESLKQNKVILKTNLY